MQRPLRIAQVSPYGLSRFGGVRSHIQGLGEALMARGHEVTVIAPGGDDMALDGTPTALGTLPVIRCGAVRAVDFGGTHFDIAWASRAEIQRALAPGYDLLHLHTPWNPAVPLQLGFAFRGTRVATFHDVPGVATPWWATRLMPLGASLIRTLLLHATIGVSPAVSRYLGEGTHVVIPNGIGDPITGSAPDASWSTAPPLVYLGRLEARKDVRTLLQAMALVRRTLGDATPPLLIAGDGPLRAALEDEAQQLGVGQVRFCGAIGDADKWALLANALGVVAPSRAGESFGIVLLEAMRAGSVPIAADNPGYRQLLSGGGETLVFPAGDANALAQRIVRLVQDAPWRERMHGWCAAHWPRFAWTQVAAEVEQLYLRASSRP